MPRSFGIGNEPSRIDDDPAAVEFRMEQIGKHLGRQRTTPLRRQNADADRAKKFVVEIDAKAETVRQLVKAISDALRLRRQNCSLAQICAIAQPVNLVLFFGRLREAIVDMFKWVCA